MKVIALIHENPETLPEDKKEPAPERQAKLDNFVEKVRRQRSPGYWKTSEDIAHKAIISLNNMIKESPATGWVRGNIISNEILPFEISELRKENDALQKKKFYKKKKYRN